MRMGSRMIFCGAFCGATIVVILLALLSPNASKTLNKSHTRPLLDLSLYIQKPHLPSSSSASSNSYSPPFGYDNAAATFIFHRLLTEGPKNNSRVVGKAQGFIISAQQFSQLPLFNVIFLTFERPKRSGSLSLQAAREAGSDNDDKDTDEEFRVVGGTGSFVFACGVVVFSRINMGSSHVDATCYARFQLQFPNQSPKTTA